MLPDVYRQLKDWTEFLCMIQQQQRARLHHSLQGFTALLCSMNAFWSWYGISENSTQVIHKLLIWWSYWLHGVQGEKKWLTVLIQTHSVVGLHKSSQNFRYSVLSGYVKQSLGVKANTSIWKTAIITHNLGLNKIQIAVSEKKTSCRKKYTSPAFSLFEMTVGLKMKI